MHAIIETGGKQYKVAEGDTLVIEKLPNAAGDAVTLDPVGQDHRWHSRGGGRQGGRLRGEERQGQEDPGLQV